ncbi:MAG: glycosyltransferase [Desulfovibrio sp.]|jgi:glycosyltransferase involved in cell wall biosynthesis|nr:glycosyltransferase [Desulfovibrio sp.]
MRTAVVHYWLTGMRGGEKVLDAILDVYPDADVFTHVYVPEAICAGIRRHRVFTTYINRLPFAARHYAAYLPLMPHALEQLDLREYDLVISSESGPAKGVLARSDALHVCYCHTPMRYLWDFYQQYLQECGPVTRLLFRMLATPLRVWDACSAQRVDFFVANSFHVARRIMRDFRRNSTVIHPPVDVDRFAPSDGAARQPEDFYLCVGQLIPYKRVDQAISACALLGRRLVVIGRGKEEMRLRKLAGPNVTFLGRTDEATLVWHLLHCRALLFPGEEDFGIVPVEAMAAGCPVIAYGRGGALETVVQGKTGELYADGDVAGLSNAILKFEGGCNAYDEEAIRLHARQFSKERFKERFRRFVDDCLEGQGGAGMASTPGEPRVVPGPPADGLLGDEILG